MKKGPPGCFAGYINKPLNYTGIIKLYISESIGYIMGLYIAIDIIFKQCIGMGYVLVRS